MLDPFGVGSGHGRRDTQSLKKGNHCFVPSLHHGGELPPFFRQKNGPIRLCRHQSLALKALYGTDNSDMSDSQNPCKIGGPSLPTVLDEIGDCLYIILRPFLGMLNACETLMIRGIPNCRKHEGIWAQGGRGRCFQGFQMRYE